MNATPELVKTLRERTGAGIMECKRALEKAGGDLDRAAQILREEGVAKADKKVGRAAGEGVVAAWISPAGDAGALLELNCETDFVARNEMFQTLGRDIAMQVAAKSPQYVSQDDVPADVVESEKHIYRQQALGEGKPEKIVDRIAEGRLNKFYEDVCLLNQPFVKDDSKTIQDLLNEHIAKLGENILIGRFVRFKVGEA